MDLVEYWHQCGICIWFSVNSRDEELMSSTGKIEGEILAIWEVVFLQTQIVTFEKFYQK